MSTPDTTHSPNPMLDLALAYAAAGRYPRALWREAGNIVQWKPDNNNYRRRSAA